MYKYRKIISIVAAMLILFGTLAFGGADRAKAWEPGFYEFDIPTLKCSDLNEMSLVTYPYLAGITSPFGFKIEGELINYDYNGTFYFTSDYGVLTGGAPSDPVNYVTITQPNEYSFNWLASLGIDAVIVKAKDERVYVYDPEAYTGTNLSTIGDKQISHIEFCYDYELTADKTANASYTRTYTWDIDKEDNGTYTGFIGDPAFDHPYTVTVDQTVTDSDWLVSGLITVNNPTPYTVNFSVEDSVGGVPASVSCHTYELAPGASTECTYSAELEGAVDGTNTATITSLKSGVGGATATAGYTFGAPIIKGYPTINVTDDKYGDLGEVSDDKTFTYSGTFQCSANQSDYTNGVWTMKDFVNTASIDEIPTKYDSATVKLTCYAPVLDKDAYTNWEERYDWEITKYPDGTYKGFIGDAAFDHDYTVEVDLTKVPQNFKVYGEIDVTNPADSPGNMTVSLVDKLDALTSATVDCGEGATSVTVAPGATETCAYSGYLASKTDGTNTATGTFKGLSFVTTEAYAFGAATPVGFTTINVTDDKYGSLGSATDDTSFAVTGSFQCSGTPGDYVNGVWTMTQFVNTATIDETGQSDSATVDLTCYAPVVSKTAAGTYDERHEWDVDKIVTPETNSGLPGDMLGWTWKVTVKETVVEENFDVAGTITIKNYHPTKSMSVSLADELSDFTDAILLCELPLIVPAAGEATCDYTAADLLYADDAAAPDMNYVTATFNEIDFTAKATISWTAGQIRENATLTDDQGPLNESLAGHTQSGTYTFDPFTYSDSQTCSANKADYFVDGVYTQISKTIVNWAYVYSDEVEQDKDDATTTWTCDAGFVDLLKLTDGLVDPLKNWSFALYVGPDGFGGTQVGVTSSTSGDVDGILDFGMPTLRPDTTYTICELGVAAGWTSRWEVALDDGSPLVGIVAYDPNADDTVPEDLGNRCVDFGKNTSIPVTVGKTVHFKVDNTYPGGDPRTPGYWKNWNTCTGGGQAATAEANGGYAEGFWLLDDVLNGFGIGGGIVWDDILTNDTYTFSITKCLDAVNILDKRTLDGRKVASDPLHNLATHLLAAQLNFAAGACTSPEINAKAREAEELLDKYNFNGLSHDSIPKKSTDATLANTLASYLDLYNNGEFCGSDSE